MPNQIAASILMSILFEAHLVTTHAHHWIVRAAGHSGFHGRCPVTRLTRSWESFW